MEYAWNMDACKFNHDQNALKYEKHYSKLGAVFTRRSQDILVYTGTYQVDKVNGLHIVFFNFDCRIQCKVCGRCIHAYSNIGKSPSSTKILGVVVSTYPGISLDIMGYPRMRMGILYPGISQHTLSHPGISRWSAFQMKVLQGHTDTALSTSLSACCESDEHDSPVVIKIIEINGIHNIMIKIMIMIMIMIMIK
jgi:hypothetical protein